jgi:hypothetical protein
MWLEAPEAGDNVEIQKGLLFKDLPTLRRWLQKYSVRRKRLFKVRHSYVECRYTVVCEKVDCNWRVCAQKQKSVGKFRITKIVGPHTCVKKGCCICNPHFLRFYLYYMNSFHYLCNIKLNIMTINNETNSNMKGPITGHIKQYNNI